MKDNKHSPILKSNSMRHSHKGLITNLNEGKLFVKNQLYSHHTNIPRL